MGPCLLRCSFIEWGYFYVADPCDPCDMRVIGKEQCTVSETLLGLSSVDAP